MATSTKKQKEPTKKTDKKQNVYYQIQKAEGNKLTKITGYRSK